MFHHANLDRNRMKFMSGNYDKKDYFWGYPTEGLNVPETKTRYANYSGVGLNEVASAQWPFSSEDLGLDTIESDGVTHGEILCHLSPYSAPYMYADPHDCDAFDRLKCKASRSCLWKYPTCHVDACFGTDDFITLDEHTELCSGMESKTDCWVAGCSWATGISKCRKKYNHIVRCRRLDADSCCLYSGCQYAESIGICRGSFEGFSE